MAVIRVQKNANYTCMSNYHLRDKRLSNKAIGLMCKMLSLPDDWDYTLQGLTAICKDGRETLRSQVKELEDAGYLIRKTIKNDKGQFCDIEYTLHEYPISENHTSDNQMSEKHLQLNTKELNTKELSKEENKEPTTTIDQEVLSLYQDNIHPITAIEMEKLEDDIERYGKTWCIEAIKRAVLRNKRSLGYVEGILRGWETNGFDDGEKNEKKAPEPPAKKIVYIDETPEYQQWVEDQKVIEELKNNGKLDEFYKKLKERRG